MLCDVCRERDATVTLTHAVKGEVNVLHLCQRCAADRGIETTVTTPLKNMIADYLPAVQALMKKAAIKKMLAFRLMIVSALSGFIAVYAGVKGLFML